MEVNQFPGFHSNIPSGCHDAFFFQLLEKCLLSQELVYTHQFHVRRDHLHFLSLYNVLHKVFKKFLTFTRYPSILCSAISAPVGSPFAGALRYVNISSPLSGSLMTRPLNNANMNLSLEGVSFKGLLPVVSEVYSLTRKTLTLT